MGRKTDVLLRGFRAAKCLTLLKLATGRIKIMRNKRSIAAKQMRAEIAHLLKSGQDAHVYITKADALIKQENMVAAFDIIDQYCHAIIARFPMIEMQSACPIDMRGPIASLIYAAPRCPEISELVSIKEAFTAKYGKEFAAAASELRPDSGVNKQVIELLSTRPATGDVKLKMMKEICAEYKVDWKPGEALGGPSTSTPAGSSQQPVEASPVAHKATPAAAAPVRIGQASEMKTTVQGAPKHGGTSESGTVGMDPSRYPSTKHGQGDSGKAKETAAQNVKGDATPGNSGANIGPPPKASFKLTDGAALATAASASKSSSTKHSGGDLAKTDERRPPALTGGSTAAPLGTKFGLVAAKESLKRADGTVVFPTNPFKSNATTEGSMGRVSFSTVQSGQGDRKTEISTASSGYVKESKVEAAAKAEDDVRPVVADFQDGSSDSDNDSFVSVEEGLEDDAETSSMGGAVRRESFGKSSLQASVSDNVIGPDLIRKPSREAREDGVGTVSVPEDAFSKPSNEGSSLMSSQDYMHLKASRTNSLNTAALPPPPPPDENLSRAESRKSSFREDKISGLAMESSPEDIFLRASSKSTFSMEALPEAKAFTAGSLKSSSKEKEGAGEQSFKQIREDILMKQQQSFKAGVQEGVPRKDVLEAVLPGITTGSSFSDTLVEGRPPEESLYTSSEETRDNGLQRKDFKEETASVAVVAKSSIVESIDGSKNVESFSYKISAEEAPAEGSKEVSIEGISSDIQELPESVSKQMDEVPCIHKEMQDLIGTSSSGAPTAPDDGGQDFAAVSKQMDEVPCVHKEMQDLIGTSSSGASTAPDDGGQDFAAAAQAIAAEAARLAVLDYMKQITGSGSIPVDLPDLTNLGLDLEAIKEVLQEMTKLKSVGKNELDDSQEAQYEGNIRKDVINEEASKVKVTAHGDEGSTIDELGGIEDAEVEKLVHSSTLAAVDEGESVRANQEAVEHVWPSTKEERPFQQSEIPSEDDINPFASRNEKATNSLFVTTEDDVHSSWVAAPKPEVVSKAGGFGQEQDHLDVFFNRRTPRFDEDGYGFGNATLSFLGERVSFLGDGKKESIFQDKFVASPMFGYGREDAAVQETFAATAVFDSLPESSPSMLPLEEEESSESFKVPVFDDEGPEDYDASFSLDDGFHKSTFSVGHSDLERPPSPRKEMPSARFDPEPEPSFDEMVDKEEQFGSEDVESAPKSQLKWHSKKVTRASDQGEMVASDASSGGAKSRRTRRQPQRMNEQEYGGSDISPVQERRYTYEEELASKRPQEWSSSSVQQQWKEQGRRAEYDVAEQGSLRTRPAESYAYSSDALNRRPWSSLKEETQAGRWDSASTLAEDRLSSGRSKQSSVRLPPQQRISPPQQTMLPLQQGMRVEGGDEDFYFPDEKDRDRSKRSSKSPTRVATPQPWAQIYGDDDEAGYNLRYKPSRKHTSSQQDLFEHESMGEEPSARSKPLRQRSDLGEGMSAGVGMYRQKQHPHTEDYEPESLRTQYSQVNGGSRSQLPSYAREKPSPPSPWLPQYEQDDEEEEFDSMQLPDWQQEELRKEEEQLRRPRYGWKQGSRPERESSSSSTENSEQQEEEQRRPSMVSAQEHDKQRRPLPYGHRTDSKFQNDSHQTLQQDNIPREQRMPASDHRKQQRFAEETTVQQQQGRENEHLSSPAYRKQQERYGREKSFGSFKDQLQEEDRRQPSSTPLPEGKQEHDGQGNENSLWPSHGRKQQSKLEEKQSESQQQMETLYQQQDKLTVDGRKQKTLAREESMKGQQEKTRITEQLPAEIDGVKGPQEKPDTKTQPSTRRPPLPAQSTSPSLESSISDPILLAMTPPPPVKKPAPPAAASLDSTVSAPSSSAPDVKAPKVPQKPPNVEDLLANFEALRRARRGE